MTDCDKLMARENEVEQLKKKLEELERDRTEIVSAFEDNNKQAYEDGFSQGRSYQAIIQVRGNAAFIDRLLESLCEKCKKVAFSQRP